MDNWTSKRYGNHTTKIIAMSFEMEEGGKNDLTSKADEGPEQRGATLFLQLQKKRVKSVTSGNRNKTRFKSGSRMG